MINIHRHFMDVLMVTENNINYTTIAGYSGTIAATRSKLLALNL